MKASGDEHDAAVRKAWDDYRCIPFEWNDGINRNLALLQQYFGAYFRDRFDYEVGPLMVDIGKNLEAIARHHTYDSDLRQSLAERLNRLSGYIYRST